MTAEPPLENRRRVPDLAQVAFLADLVDYAGLFPPASLSVASAWQKYQRYRLDHAWWLLGRFLIPSGRLASLADEAAADLTAARRPFPLVVIAQPAASGGELVQRVVADLEQIQAVRSRSGPALEVDAYEVRLPASGVAANALADATHRLLEAGLRPFFELSPAGRWIGAMRRFVAQLPAGAAFKLRCGGTAPTPPATAVAATIDATRDAGVPLKATAGLHHPFTLPAKDEFGFVNLFAAAILADAHGLVESTVKAILTDPQEAHFALEGEHLSWQEWRVSANMIRTRRRRHVVSFGSCDFEEPRAALMRLGWLGASRAE